MTEYGHKPVLLDEVINGLNIRPGGCYVDCTFGRGGHSRIILRDLGDHGRLFVFDKDPQAITAARSEHAGDDRVIMTQGSYIQLESVLRQHQQLGSVDGILLDLGISSPQLDEPERGFSFQNNGALDMRMDTGAGITAAQWLNEAGVQEMTGVFRKYGEERYARRIARAIAEKRQETRLESTLQLAELIAAVVPSRERDKHPATRVFQAIRIYINRELEELEEVLPQCLSALSPGGRLVTISFHSLEDRIVKRFIRDQEHADPYPPDLPVKADMIKPKLRKVSAVVKASVQEVGQNPRARSAVMRVAERTTA